MLLRPATDDEVAALEHARRRGGEFDLPGRSFSYAEPLRAPGPGEIYVVAQPFVEFEREGALERWDGAEYHGRFVSTERDATLDLLELVEDARENLVDLFADMRTARFDLSSTPRPTDAHLPTQQQLTFAPAPPPGLTWTDAHLRRMGRRTRSRTRAVAIDARQGVFRTVSPRGPSRLGRARA